MQKRIIIVFLFIAVTLTACQATDSEVFSDQCSAPCWRNIEPGRTQKEEALAIIEEFNDVKDDEINIGGTLELFTSSIHFDLQNEITVRVYFINDIVALIRFEKSNGISTFEKCLDEFGVPQKAARTYLYGSGSPIGATTAIHPWFFALYPDEGVVIGYDTFQFLGAASSILPKSKVSVINFFDIPFYEELLERGFLVYIDLSEEISTNDLNNWQGYGIFDELYPDRK
jgi:hypothetical protein